jgi:hypothetical protein
MKLSNDFSGALRTFAYFMASGSHRMLQDVEYLELYGTEPSAIEMTFAIFANVIEKPFVQRNHTRVSSIDMSVSDTEDLNKKQSGLSIIQRIIQKLIENNMNLDDYV